MPAPGRRWWHVMIGTYCAWLPGDSRGFRSKAHRIHSSGDYRNPPPPSEHAGLRQFHQQRHPDPVQIPYELRGLVAQTIAQVLHELGLRVLIVSVSAKHAHILGELPLNLREFNRVIGICKNRSSRAIRRTIPGRVWARGDMHRLVRNRAHRKQVYLYLRDRQGPQAVAWYMKLVFDD
ncbi:hypothetical protein [Fontivita pretiosa]|uniref:hypothetical protein n=1 Tax=Fontivita pretiosa TaxID=2989684 RepID=UPI003D17E243